MRHARERIATPVTIHLRPAINLFRIRVSCQDAEPNTIKTWTTNWSPIVWEAVYRNADSSKSVARSNLRSDSISQLCHSHPLRLVRSSSTATTTITTGVHSMDRSASAFTSAPPYDILLPSGSGSWLYTLLAVLFTLLALEQSIYRYKKSHLPGATWTIPIIGKFADSLNPTMEGYIRQWNAGDLSAVSVFNMSVPSSQFRCESVY